MRVLLLDDDPFVLRLIERQLQRLGATFVRCCTSATAMLSALDKEQVGYDALFIDLHLPGMDGIELLRHLASRRYRGGLALCSGEDGRVLQCAATLARAQHLHVVGTLRKPVSPAQLATVLDQLAQPRPIARLESLPSYTGADIGTGIRARQLVNHYQPQVDFTTGRVVAVEALVRWQHPVDGLVGPDRFVPAAETSGSSVDLARAVLANAFRDARLWRDAGLELRLSINVSMNDLVDLDFPDELERAIASADFEPDQLVLEITETQLNRDRTALLDIATRLRLKRVGLAIDDYGTAYAALALLRDVPFDELKLDRSFIHGVAHNDALRAMVEANIAMARHLGIRTVAEGIEDLADWHFLHALGCNLAQGYLIARPMPAPQLIDWVRQWHGQIWPSVTRGGVVANV